MVIVWVVVAVEEEEEREGKEKKKGRGESVVVVVAFFFLIGKTFPLSLNRRCSNSNELTVGGVVGEEVVARVPGPEVGVGGLGEAAVGRKRRVEEEIFYFEFFEVEFFSRLPFLFCPRFSLSLSLLFLKNPKKAKLRPLQQRTEREMQCPKVF